MKVAVLRTPASVHDMMSLLSISDLESQKVSYGLRISRLSKDLYELLTELDLNDVALPGHSMGSSLIAHEKCAEVRVTAGRKPLN